ncbi:mitochondrial ribosomal protein s35 [Cystoisospora suis]|uniref:Mitochondrial ribosomal protein s35 n=1 Tax=Cystoisospora suis TaxID=483139 RepID=A0A2C6LI53_9APIC|nr:mitochondrial ribosomal protein s35 [Cystoisospora suis]
MAASCSRPLGGGAPPSTAGFSHFYVSEMIRGRPSRKRWSVAQQSILSCKGAPSGLHRLPTPAPSRRSVVNSWHGSGTPTAPGVCVQRTRPFSSSSAIFSSPSEQRQLGSPSLVLSPYFWSSRSRHKLGGSAGPSQLWEALPDGFVPGGGLSAVQVRWKKKRGKKEKVTLNAEQQSTKVCLPPIRLEDRSTPEPPSTVARNIRSQVSRAVAGWKTKRMFTYRNKYRLRRFVGLTHDADSEDEDLYGNSGSKGEKIISAPRRVSSDHGVKPAGSNRKRRARTRYGAVPVGRSFVTPLTKLQHQAVLPRSPLHSRFSFPHTLHYDVFWGPPQVEEEPSKTECRVSFRLGDLKLTDRQEQRLLDIVGPERHDRTSGIVCLEADVFPKLCHNAAYLGDILQRLMWEVETAQAPAAVTRRLCTCDSKEQGLRRGMETLVGQNTAGEDKELLRRKRGIQK